MKHKYELVKAESKFKLMKAAEVLANESYRSLS